jgi:hypothetical protein
MASFYEGRMTHFKDDVYLCYSYEELFKLGIKKELKYINTLVSFYFI